MRRNIIIDCDPGIDDAIAIMCAIAHEEELNILGITTVSGNQIIDNVTANALKLSSFLGRKIKVARGSEEPLLRERKIESDIHGKTGMGNYELPPATYSEEKENAIEFLKNTILSSPEKVTLVPIGPLTNIALLLKVYPEVKKNIEELVIMGGGICVGNVTPTAEFNVWADPEAAQIVMKSGLKIVMNGLDVTHNTGLYKQDIVKLKQSNGRVSKVCGEILDYYFERDHVKDATFAPIHDASTIMYMIHPEIFEFKHMPVVVDCSEGLNRGMTVGDNRDWMHYDESYPKVLLGANVDKFREYLLDAIKKLDEEVI